MNLGGSLATQSRASESFSMAAACAARPRNDSMMGWRRVFCHCSFARLVTAVTTGSTSDFAGVFAGGWLRMGAWVLLSALRTLVLSVARASPLPSGATRSWQEVLAFSRASVRVEMVREEMVGAGRN